jgi:hypothetical protein
VTGKKTPAIDSKVSLHPSDFVRLRRMAFTECDCCMEKNNENKRTEKFSCATFQESPMKWN